MKKTFVIIDGKSVFYRGFYAMPNLQTSEGIPTGGVYGFLAMGLEIINRLKPDYVAVAWDKPKTNIRKRLAMYPEYKAGRKPAPQEFYDQIPILHQVLEFLGWPLYELDDYEADDIMGTLATQASEEGIETILITSDLDLLQLIKNNIKVYILKKGLSNFELYSPEYFQSKHSISVKQFLDLKSLKGDSSDNIPGVLGIGEKIATELLLKYDSLDNIYQNIELIPGTVQKKLKEGKKSAYLSKELARIWCDAPLKLNLNEVNGSKNKPQELFKLLNKLQFKSLAIKLTKLYPELSKHNQNKENVILQIDTKLVEINNQNIESISSLIDFKEVFIFTRSLKEHGLEPIYLFLKIEKKEYFIDLRKIDREKLITFLYKIKFIIGYDLKVSQEVFLELGAKLPAVRHDILIADFLLENISQGRRLSDIALDLLGISCDWINELDNQQVLERAVHILKIIQEIYQIQLKKSVEFPKFDKLLKEFEFPMINVLAKMEKIGIFLDVKALDKFNIIISNKISDLTKSIYDHAGEEFNIASPAQLSTILFSRLNLPSQGIKKTKASFSTAASELNKLLNVHPIISDLIEYREVVKLKNTYLDTLPKLIDTSSILHTTYSLTNAQTGRLSSIKPNLQNIPIKTDLGKEIRKCFIARKGTNLISADYSQFELRIAAFLANDQELIDQFNEGLDIHSMTAAQIYQRNIEDVTDQMRRAAKTINFGILYGMSIHGLTQATGMGFNQAKDFIERYKQVRKPIFDYMNKVLEEVKKNGYAETYFGRRRYFPEINSSNFILRQAAERAAINMPIQGTESELMKLAMIKLDHVLEEQHNNAKILLQIHDSVVVECPMEITEHLKTLIRSTMENIYVLPVNIEVDLKNGTNWGEL